MKIGVLGAGQVGSRLRRAWAQRGHEIMFSSRNPQSEKMQTLLMQTGENAQAGSVQETIDFGDIILVALHWDVLEGLLPTLQNWGNKIVVDVTNRFIPPPPDSAGSAGQDMARLTGANVIKALNHIGAEHMLNPEFPDGSPTIFLAGDDANAKATVRELVEQLGFEVHDLGWLREAVHMEALAKLWVHIAYNTKIGRNVAFRLLSK